MKDFKDNYLKIKPWIILSTYILILLLIVLNFETATKIFTHYFGYVKPLLYAIGISYVLNIPMCRIESFLKHRFSKVNYIMKHIRVFSIALTVVGAVILITLFSVFVLPQLFTSIGELINNGSQIVSSFQTNINDLLAFFHIDLSQFDFSLQGLENLLKQYQIDWDSFMKSATSWLTEAGFNAMNFALQFAGGVTNFVIGFCISFYLLSAKETLVRQLKKLTVALFNKKHVEIIVKYGQKVNNIFSRFVGGQLVEAVIIGLLIYFMMVLSGMPYAVLVGSVTTMFAIVPVFGAFIAMLFGAVLIFAIDPMRSIWFMVLYQLVQAFENNFIYPRVVGSSVGLPSLWTLLAMIVFGGLYGMLGMLVAVPVTASAYTIVSDIVNHFNKKKGALVTNTSICYDGQNITDEIQKID